MIEKLREDYDKAKKEWLAQVKIHEEKHGKVNIFSVTHENPPEVSILADAFWKAKKALIACAKKTVRECLQDSTLAEIESIVTVSIEGVPLVIETELSQADILLSI